MAFCPNCGNPAPEDGTFCAFCGTPMEAQPAAAPAQPEPAAQPEPVAQPMPAAQPAAPVPPVNWAPPAQPVPPAPPMPYMNPSDHTAEFEPKDISDNKVVAMASYMLGTLGIIIALLAAPQSPFAGFHSRQALKLDILNILIGIASLVLCWTFIVPILGGISILVLLVVRIICFFNVCAGKAKAAPIVSSLPFLK